MKIITNGIVFKDGKWLKDVDIVMEDNIIEGIVNTRSDIEGIDVELIDAEGGYVCPGFINIHIHGAMGYDVMDGTEEAIRGIGKFSAQHGTTSFLPTTVTGSIESTKKTLKKIEMVMREGYEGANILGTHLEGPFIAREYKGAQMEVYIQEPSIENYLKLVGDFGNIVKLVTIAPELEGAKDLIEYLKGQDVHVSMGHTGADYDTCIEAFKWGVSHVTHCYNGMVPLHHRNPGVIGAAFDRKDITIELITDLIHIHPAMLRLAMRTKGAEGTAIITDSMSATGLGDGKYLLGEEDVWVKNGIARTAEGSLAGSTLTQDKALKNIVDIGIPLAAGVEMLSTTPAKVIGVDTYKGRIEAGYDADIIILDKRDLQVRHVFIQGRQFK